MISSMSISGTDAHAAADPATLPPLVRRALAAARRHGFAYACRPEQGRLLTPGGAVVVDDFTPATGWPPLHEGAPDLARLHWLEHVALHTVELRLAEDLATLVGTRRRLAPTGPSSSSE